VFVLDGAFAECVQDRLDGLVYRFEEPAAGPFGFALEVQSARTPQPPTGKMVRMPVVLPRWPRTLEGPT
jgi:hypothetical protein